jgi:hypothetical protein
MKKIFAVMFAMLFAASTSVFAAKHMGAEKADEKKADAKAAPAKADAKKAGKAEDKK